MCTVDELIAWLREQLDYDELVAQRVEPNQAPADLRAMVTRDGSEPFLIVDSGRVLAEVDARRTMLVRLESLLLYATDPDLGSLELIAWATGSLKVEATPFADRAGYRDEWRVTA